MLRVCCHGFCVALALSAWWGRSGQLCSLLHVPSPPQGTEFFLCLPRHWQPELGACTLVSCHVGHLIILEGQLNGQLTSIHHFKVREINSALRQAKGQAEGESSGGRVLCKQCR